MQTYKKLTISLLLIVVCFIFYLNFLLFFLGFCSIISRSNNRGLDQVQYWIIKFVLFKLGYDLSQCKGCGFYLIPDNNTVKSDTNCNSDLKSQTVI